MIAERVISNDICGEFRTQRFHRINIDIDKKILEFVCENELDCYEDYETSFSNGICIGFNEGISWINIKPFLEELTNYIEEKVEEDGEDELNQNTRMILELLKPYEDYVLSFDEDKE